MAELQGQQAVARQPTRWTPATHGWRQPNPSAVTTGRWARSWPHVSAVVSEMAFTGGFGVDRSCSADRLVVILEEVGERIQASSNRAMQPGPDRPHRLYYVPSGAPFWTFAEKPLSLRFVSLEFASATLQGLDQGASALLGSPRLAFFDPRLLALARLFEVQCRADEPSDRLLGDSLALRLLALLSYTGADPTVGVYRGGLTTRQVRMVKEHLDGDLCEAVDLVELARVAGLSPSHFHRAFRATMGAPPHRWLTCRRVRRAQELMLDRARSMAEIALETGFADQSHFTRVFSKEVGVSPGAWRRIVV